MRVQKFRRLRILMFLEKLQISDTFESSSPGRNLDMFEFSIPAGTPDASEFCPSGWKFGREKRPNSNEFPTMDSEFGRVLDSKIRSLPISEFFQRGWKFGCVQILEFSRLKSRTALNHRIEQKSWTRPDGIANMSEFPSVTRKFS